METVYPLPTTTDDASGVLGRLTSLLKLEVELGLAEMRTTLVSAVLAVVTALAAIIAGIASIVVLIAAGFAPFFGARWEPLLISGGGVFLLSIAALTWSAYRLTHLRWPSKTLMSFEENWRWLGAQLRSRLTWC